MARAIPDQTRIDQDDRDLMARVAAGDRTLAGEFVNRHRADVVTFVHRMTGDRELAEDLAQETFIRALVGAERFVAACDAGARGNARSWLLTIARHLVIDHARGKRALPVAQLPETPVQATGLDGAARIEARERVAAAIARLDEPFRSVLVLVDISGLAYAEAATVLGVPFKTISSRLARARAQLTELLDPSLLEDLE